jgi:cytochrome c oxidase cbb3-type subunit 3
MNQDPKQAEHDHLLDHSYDGIQEYDNPLPRWWLYIFYATILYSVVYFINVPGIGTGRGRMVAYDTEVAAARAKAEALAARQPAVEVTDHLLRAAAADPAKVEAGSAVFSRQCMPCHRADGGGSIGPNLTDEYWIHGGRPTDMYRTVTQGVLEKGMPAWNTVLKPDEMMSVVGYVLTLHDTHPPNPKAPQGAKVEEEEEEEEEREETNGAAAPSESEH